MKKTKSLQSLLRHFWVMGVFLSLLFPAVGLAKSNAGNPEIIAQIGIVKQTLAELGNKLDALDEKLDAQGVDLNLKLDALDTKLDAQEDDLNVKLAALGGDLDFLVEDAESQEKDITISNTLCFSAAAYKAFEIGVHAEAGVGWPNVLDAKLVAEIDAKAIGIDINLSEQICIEVPLYKVASAPLAEFNNTQDFDALIADIVAPSQAIIPIVATLYTAVMPSKAEAMQATANVIEAATGFDILTGITGPPHLENFLHPEIMFAPVISESFQKFVAFVPNAVATMATDPCQALMDSPLGVTLNNTPFCAISNDVAHIALNLADPFHLFHPHTGHWPDL